MSQAISVLASSHTHVPALEAIDPQDPHAAEHLAANGTPLFRWNVGNVYELARRGALWFASLFDREKEEIRMLKV